MTMPVAQSTSEQTMRLLSRLLLAPQGLDSASTPRIAELKADLKKIDKADFGQLVELANLNHVIVRGMEYFLDAMLEAGDNTRATWAGMALRAERERISVAVKVLHDICGAFEQEGHDIAVIKSLDH